MTRIFVGVSQYGALRGKAQYSEERAGLQILAVLAIVNAQLPADERVYINEAQRPRAEQLSFWNDMVRRGAPPAVVAARPFSSKHDGGPNDDQGRAFDLGGPGGAVITNRAHALVKSVGAEYGIHHTGAGFRPAEKWHFEYVPGTARKLASAGPTEQEEQESVMTAITYRNSKSGEMRTIDISTGMDDYLLPGYFELQVKLGVTKAPAMNVPDNEFAYLRQKAAERDAAAAARVWGHVVTGWNGPQAAANRLQGIDQKAGTAKLDASSVVVTIDEASLVGKITQAMKAMFTKAGS